MIFKGFPIVEEDHDAPAVNSSPSDRPSSVSNSRLLRALRGPTNLGLHLNVLRDHIRSSVPEIDRINSGELVSMMKSAAETVAGAAALKAVRAALFLLPNQVTCKSVSISVPPRGRSNFCFGMGERSSRTACRICRS